MTGPPLVPMDRRLRVERLRAALASIADSILVTKLVNLRWLFGFTGSSGMAFVSPEHLIFITDGRYQEQAEAEITASRLPIDLRITTDPADLLAKVSQTGARVALEADNVTWAQQRVAATKWFAASELIATKALIEGLRERKDPAEIQRIERAATIADRALAEVRPLLTAQATEYEIATDLEAAMRSAGADQPAFPTIVASGPNSARPHHQPGPRPVTEGDLVVIDMGAMVDGYCSDMTRTFSIGQPSAEQARLLDVVTAANSAGQIAARAGVATKTVDATARAVIVGAGWGDYFVHPTGHGLGLEIHEPLRLSATSDATLIAGHVVTVEPGVYLPGVGGARLENTLEITPDGNRPLTRSPIASVID